MKNTKKSPNEKKHKMIRDFVESLPNSSLKINNIVSLLSLLLPFLKNVLHENVFRYMLGMISFHCVITAKQLAKCARCSTKTISKGRKEFRKGLIPDFCNSRTGGAGRKHIIDDVIGAAIIKYVQLRSYGPCTKDIQDYTAATLTSIQKFIKKKYGKVIAKTTLRLYLIEHDIRLRTNKKLLYGNEKSETSDQRLIRHCQFDNIIQVLELVNDPNCIVLSSDVKKKENLGAFQAQGKSYSFKGEDVKTLDHDFIKKLNIYTLKDENDLLDRMEGKAIPHCLYDISMNKAYFSVGISSDTPEFNAVCILRHIQSIKKDHPHAKKLYILCDGGGSNSSRSNLFKYYITEVSKTINMPIIIVHYPPYRSKFNPVERKVFANVSRNFERSPLYNLRTVIALIESTTTENGLVCVSKLDTNIYKTGIKLTNEQIKKLHIKYIKSPSGIDTKLMYCIDGRNFQGDQILAQNLKTVFEIKQEIESTKKANGNRRKTKKNVNTLGSSNDKRIKTQESPDESATNQIA